eukprot:4875642-Prymnesium_polylepis.1
MRQNGRRNTQTLVFAGVRMAPEDTSQSPEGQPRRAAKFQRESSLAARQVQMGHPRVCCRQRTTCPSLFWEDRNRCTAACNTQWGGMIVYHKLRCDGQQRVTERAPAAPSSRRAIFW